METAFFNTTVECPICKKENRFDTIRVGAYVESGRDTDFCPKDIKWRFPEYANHNPLAYFVATCPNCLYSREFNDSFKKWQNDTTFKTYKLKRVKERHLEELAKDGSIVKELGALIDLEKQPDASAIAKLLLAIYDEKLNDRPSNLDLGRLYIRLGWVFRAMSDSPSDDQVTQADNQAGFDSELKTWMQSMQTLRDTRDKLFAKMDTQENETGNSFNESKEQILAHENKLFELAASIQEKSSSQIAMLSTIGSDSENQNGTPDIYAQMASLKQRWDGVPLSERQALQMAAESYQSALEEGKEVSAGNQQVQVCYLIAELSRRIGKHEEARDFFNSALKVGQEFVRRYQSDESRTALARKILELAMEQSQINRDAMKEAVAK